MKEWVEEGNNFPVGVGLRFGAGGLLLKEAVRAAAFCSVGFIQQGLSSEEMILASEVDFAFALLNLKPVLAHFQF